MKRLLILLLVPILALNSCHNPDNQKKNTSNSIQADTSAKTESDNKNKIAVSKTNSKIKISTPAQKYSLRRHQNVGHFYARIAKKATAVCMENNVPPAAILAMTGLESGWNQGYIGKITGNILSLGTRKGDYELPALRLPTLKLNGEILYDSLEIIKYSKDELNWKKRPNSLKKDYRPLPYAGSKYNLAYFKHNPVKEAQAHIQNITDFVTLFISRNSKIPIYRNVRKLMDEMVAENGKEILLESSTANLFINEIGGKPYSFNYRETWPKKVKKIIKNAGLADLTKELYKNKKDFKSIWKYD